MSMRMGIAAACLVAGLWACGGNGGGGDPGPGDVPPADTPEAVDVPGDAVPDAADVPAEVPADEGPGDVPGDPGNDLGCPHPPAEDAPDPARTKFALSMFHFNLQYVAGGLVTEWNGQTLTLCGFLMGDDSLCEGWDDDRLNDWIVRVTFAPVLDLYLKHPTWRVTLEMPALMLEYIGLHHPDVLEKMRQGVTTGQFEFVSFHWSDQLFLAFPTRDQERSVQMTKAVFDKYCLPLSGVVFNQEGQSGPGKHVFMTSHGYAIDVINVNQFRYDQKDVPVWPLYRGEGVDVVIGGGPEEMVYDATAGLDVKWTFFDDGEVLAAPGNPYLAPITPDPDWNSIGLYEGRVKSLEDKGYRIATLTDYVRHLKARGFEAKPLPSYVDGTWHPEQTENLHLWMGKRSKAANYNSHERDSVIRSANYRISRDLAALEVLVEAARKAGQEVGDLADDLLGAWQELLKAEVSDATGLTPWQGEFVYATRANAGAQAIIDATRATLLQRLGWPHVLVDLAAGTATRLDEVPVAEPLEPLNDGPVAVTVDAPTRTVQVEWHHSQGWNADVLDVTVGPGADPTAVDVEKCRVGVTFPRTADEVIFTPALAEDRVLALPFSGFSFEYPEVWLPLSNGLVGLGNDTWIVKDCRVQHVAARVSVTGDKVVQFVDETADPGQVHWRFWVAKGTKEEALALANRVNVTPTMIY